jgi:hypothetical protein
MAALSGSLRGPHRGGTLSAADHRQHRGRPLGRGGVRLAHLPSRCSGFFRLHDRAMQPFGCLIGELNDLGKVGLQSSSEVTAGESSRPESSSYAPVRSHRAVVLGQKNEVPTSRIASSHCDRFRMNRHCQTRISTLRGHNAEHLHPRRFRSSMATERCRRILI